MEAEENTSSEKARGYFEFLADLGLTKHIGSMKATKELVEMCHIGDDCVERVILDVGCGVGATPCYLAKTHNCHVIGVDLLPKMIERSRERARAEGVEKRVEFRLADARDLPFEDNAFDAVIVESVNAFFTAKQRAMGEYVRVTKPGGYVGITEMTWLQTPSPKTADYYMRTVYADVLEAREWRGLLESAGLKDVVAHAYKVDIPAESKGRFERYGCRGIAKVLLKTLTTLFKNPSYREFLKDVTSSLPKDMLGDMGYGVYAGRKA